MSKFEHAILLTGPKNAENAHTEIYKEAAYPEKLLYSERIDIKRKTWAKILTEAHEAASKFPLCPESLGLVKKGLA